MLNLCALSFLLFSQDSAGDPAELARSKQEHSREAGGLRERAGRAKDFRVPGRSTGVDRAAISQLGGYVGGGASDEIRAMVRDKDGNLILAGVSYSPDLKAAGGAVAHEGGNAFVQKVSANGASLLWRAILGGSKDEEIDAVAVDAAGAVYVAGWTNSVDLPTTAEAFQRTSPGKEDGFAAKLSADGKKLEYCTYLGGTQNDWINGISVDSSGQAAVTGWTGSTNFPAPSNSSKSAFTSGPGAIVARLDAAGKTLKQGTVLSGNADVEGNRILALDDGSLVVAGVTAASDLPMINSWQRTHSSAGAWKSANLGLDWKPSSDGMRGMRVRDLAMDPKQPQTLYAATVRGVYKTTDGGVSWKEANVGLPTVDVRKLAIDPINPTRIYVAAASGSVYRSSDGAASWSATGSGPGQLPYWLGVDPKDSKTVYVVTVGSGVYKSVDGGDNWTPVKQGLAGTVMVSMAIHPVTPNLLLAAGIGGLYRSDDGGMLWSRLPGLPADDIFMCLTYDPRDPQVIYAASYYDLVYKSTDGGMSWRLARTGIPLSAIVYDVQPHPTQADLVFAATDYGLYRSVNGGQSWIAPGLDLIGLAMEVVQPDPTNAGVVYAGGSLLYDGFLMHFDKDGTTVKQSSYLGGARDETVRGLAIDAAGDYYVAGGTESQDFPVAPEAWQKQLGGDYDAFVVKLDRQGRAAKYSTFLGGRQFDTARALAVDADGAVWLTGETISTDFPLTGGTPPQVAGGLGDVFLAKLTASAPRYLLDTVLGGTGVDQGAAIVPGTDGIWVAGWTSSRDLASGLSGLAASFGGGSRDGFLLKASGLAAGLAADLQSISLEVLLDGSEPRATKKLKVTSSAGVLPLQAKVQGAAVWLQAQVDGTEIVVTGDATGLVPGEYRGSIEVSAPAAGAAPVSVAVTLTVRASTPPVLAPEGALHGAQMTPGSLAPGLVIRLRGEGFAAGARKDAAEGATLPNVLGVTRVLINGAAAPLEWVSEREIAAIVPYGVSGLTQATVVVERGTVASEPVPMGVVEVSPGLFTRDGSGEGAALAKNEDGTLNTAENPAERGRPVVLAGTGAGATDPAGVDGALSLDALPKPLAEVEVLIGGQKCDVYYAGAQPGKPAGYFEFNVKVPDDAPAGPAVPVVLRIGGVESTRGVTVALK